MTAAKLILSFLFWLSTRWWLEAHHAIESHELLLDEVVCDGCPFNDAIEQSQTEMQRRRGEKQTSRAGGAVSKCKGG
jgi:hypothetical protein